MKPKLISAANLLFSQKEYLYSSILLEYIYRRGGPLALATKLNRSISFNRLFEETFGRACEKKKNPLFASKNLSDSKFALYAASKLLHLPVRLLMQIDGAAREIFCTALKDPENIILRLNALALGFHGKHYPDCLSLLIASNKISAGHCGAEWFSYYSDVCLNYGLAPQPIDLKSYEDTGDIFLSISPPDRPQRLTPSLPLVSICISAYNAENTIEYSAKSILSQSHDNIEVFLIDDCSSDQTFQVISRLAVLDKRIKPILNSKNKGTYSNRNLALELAKGDFFTIHDADDYAHNDRVSQQLDFLSSASEAIACVARWYRVYPSGEFYYKLGINWAYLHNAVATLLFKREPVISRIGYYHENRFGADSEFMNRIVSVFGRKALVELQKPLVLARQSAGSLTGNSEFGVNEIYGQSSLRRDYQASWKKWHSSGSKLYLPRSDTNALPFIG